MAYGEMNPGAPLRDMRVVRRQLDQRFGVLKSDYISSGYREWCRDISDFMQPNRGRFLTQETGKRKRNNIHIKDPEGLLAARICASGMMSGMSSRSRPWFRLTAKNRLLMRSAPVREWLNECERLMRQVFHASNFYQSIHQFYAELSVFGTAAMVEFEDYDDIVRFETLTVGEYVLAQNSRRFCDIMFREFEMTCGQMLDAGFELPESMLAEYKANAVGKRDARHTVCHMIGPNQERIVGRHDNKNMPFMSVYWLQGCEDEGGGILKFTGFEENGLIAGRWETTGNDTYGFGPGQVALQEVKQLQFEGAAKAKGIEKSLNPPMQGPASLRNELIDLMPGGITFHDDRPNSKGLTSVYGSWRPDIQAVNEDIKEVRRRVREIFYADLFMAITQMEGIQPRGEMELVERKDEKLTALGPVVDRLHREVLDPIIDRTWAIMSRATVNGEPLLPPAPKELRGQRIEVDYVSPLAQAQKALGLGNLERATGFLGNLSGKFPDAADKLNVDNLIDEYADQMALPPTVINANEDVAKIRAARAQQNQIAQLAALAPAARDGAAAAELLSRADAGRAAPLPIKPY